MQRPMASTGVQKRMSVSYTHLDVYKRQDHTDKYVQAYFQYDSKKTGGVTISHLRFGDKPIKSPYYINKADFVACHNPSYITKGFPIVRDVKPGGVFMINCQWTPEELAHHLNAASKRYIAKNNIQLYTINAIDLAQSIGMGKRTNTILQSAFFSLAKVLPEEDAIKYLSLIHIYRSHSGFHICTNRPNSGKVVRADKEMCIRDRLYPRGKEIAIHLTFSCK